MESVLEQFYQPRTEQEIKQTPLQSNEWSDTKAAIEHVSSAIRSRQTELAAYDFKLESASRRNNLGNVSVLIIKQMAMAALIGGLERMNAELGIRFAWLERRIGYMQAAIEQSFKNLNKGYENLLTFQNTMLVRDDDLTYEVGVYGWNPTLSSVREKIASQSSLLLVAYDDFNGAKQTLTATIDQINTALEEIQTLGYAFELDTSEGSIYQKACALDSLRCGLLTLQLVAQREEHAKRKQEQFEQDMPAIRARIEKTIADREAIDADPQVIAEREYEAREKAKAAQATARHVKQDEERRNASREHSSPSLLSGK